MRITARWSEDIKLSHGDNACAIVKQQARVRAFTIICNIFNQYISAGIDVDAMAAMFVVPDDEGFFRHVWS